MFDGSDKSVFPKKIKKFGSMKLHPPNSFSWYLHCTYAHVISKSLTVPFVASKIKFYG